MVKKNGHNENRRDRILWATCDLIKCEKYSSVEEISLSCHKPVYGIFTVVIKRLVNEEKKLPSDFEAISDEEVKVPPAAYNEEQKPGTLESFDMVGTSGIVYYQRRI